jgi:hypothetical protein
MRKIAAAALLLALTGCFLPPADQPAYPSRMGRFMGLIAHCGCSDVSPDRMIAEYGRAVAGRYSEAEIKSMKGYVDLATVEHFDNQEEICAEVCSQHCMVQAVVGPLGGRPVAAQACPVTERDLHLTTGRHISDND